MLYKKTSKLKAFAYFSLSMILAACAPSPEEISAEAGAEQNLSSQSLVVDRDFDFDGTTNFSVEVTNSSLDIGESYLSVCHGKANLSSVIDYENCVIRARISEVYYQQEVKVPAHFNQLHLAIWFFETSVEPIERVISSEELKSGSVVVEI